MILPNSNAVSVRVKSRSSMPKVIWWSQSCTFNWKENVLASFSGRIQHCMSRQVAPIWQFMFAGKSSNRTGKGQSENSQIMFMTFYKLFSWICKVVLLYYQLLGFFFQRTTSIKTCTCAHAHKHTESRTSLIRLINHLSCCNTKLINKYYKYIIV